MRRGGRELTESGMARTDYTAPSCFRGRPEHHRAARALPSARPYNAVLSDARGCLVLPP